MIVVLAGLLEMLLPENRIRNFVKVVMGLFVVIALLGPAAEAVKGNKELALEGFWVPVGEEQKTATVLSAGQKMGEKWGEKVWEEYQQRIARQIEAMVNLLPGVGRSEARVVLREKEGLYSLGGIESIYVKVFLTGGKAGKAEPGEDRTSFGSSVESPIAVPIITVSSSNSASREDSLLASSYTPGEEETVAKVRNLLANFYSISPEKIQVDIADRR